METSKYVRMLKELIKHSLIDPKTTPKKQRLRWFSLDKCEAIKELAKQLAASFIIKVYHTEWLANPVLG